MSYNDEILQSMSSVSQQSEHIRDALFGSGLDDGIEIVLSLRKLFSDPLPGPRRVKRWLNSNKDTHISMSLLLAHIKVEEMLNSSKLIEEEV